MNTFTTLELQRDSRGFATLWLNRPDRHNAFNARMIHELIEALTLLDEDDSLRFLLLRGRGKHFCAGADLAWMQQAAGLDFNANLTDAHQLAELMYRLYHLKVPTLAVVQGAAFGGGLGLVACCDMAIGTEDALFSLSEVRIGLAPAVISPFVVMAIGERASRRYALTAERFSGDQAHALGLLAECYAPEELDLRIADWTNNLLRNSPHALRVSKNLFQEISRDGGALSDALRRYSEHAIAHIRVSQEGQEGLAAFLHKRTPSWQESAL